MNIKVEQTFIHFFYYIYAGIKITRKWKSTLRDTNRKTKQNNQKANKRTQTLQASSTAADIRKGIWGHHIFTVEIRW